MRKHFHFESYRSQQKQTQNKWKRQQINVIYFLSTVHCVRHRYESMSRELHSPSHTFTPTSQRGDFAKSLLSKIKSSFLVSLVLSVCYPQSLFACLTATKMHWILQNHHLLTEMLHHFLICQFQFNQKWWPNTLFETPMPFPYLTRPCIPKFYPQWVDSMR